VSQQEETLVSRILRESAARIAAADAQVHESNCAFQAGKFDEYFESEYQKVEERVQDEYEQYLRSRSDDGDRQEDS